MDSCLERGERYVQDARRAFGTVSGTEEAPGDEADTITPVSSLLTSPENSKWTPYRPT